MQSVETYYPMYLLKFMKFTKFSWRIHQPMYRRVSISCSLSNGNTFQTVFKNPDRVVFEREWNEIKWNEKHSFPFFQNLSPY